LCATHLHVTLDYALVYPTAHAPRNSPRPSSPLIGFVLARLGAGIARFISQPIAGYEPITASIQNAGPLLQCGDVILVEGDLRISTAIKYLTQSTWSHAAIYCGSCGEDDSENVLVEADVELGVIRVPLSKYHPYNTRICRPVGLSEWQRARVCRHVTSRVGHKYDLKNIVDLARYLWPMPPVPTWMRRSMISLGSGDPTKAICSTLIAEAFESVGFRILPPPPMGSRRGASYTYVVPRDFDVSPFFHIVKPDFAAKQYFNERLKGIEVPT
jgi:hypothetical protein